MAVFGVVRLPCNGMGLGIPSRNSIEAVRKNGKGSP